MLLKLSPHVCWGMVQLVTKLIVIFEGKYDVPGAADFERIHPKAFAQVVVRILFVFNSETLKLLIQRPGKSP